MASTNSDSFNANKTKVCMLLSNEVLSDGRVMRESYAIAEAFDLTIIGWLRPERKERFDYELARTVPFHLKIKELLTARILPKNSIGYVFRYIELFIRFFFAGWKLKPTIIHAHEFDTFVIGYMISKVTRAKLIYDAHELYREADFPGGPFSLRLMSRIESFLMRSSDQIIACNSQRAEIMHKEYGAPFLPQVIRNLPPYTKPPESNTKLRDFTTKLNPKVEKIVVHPGGLAGRGATVALPALAKLPENVGLAIIGYSSQRNTPEISSLMKTHNLAERVFFYPRVPYAELAELVAGGDVGLVCYPNTNRNNYYCAPNKLYEYAMAGIPTVAVDYPPCREFLQQYEYGKCFAWDSPDELADAILECISSAETNIRMRKEALRAANDVNWDKEKLVLIKIYNDLIVRN